MTFEKELEILINRYSQENGSNTPDFILAEYLTGCLTAFNLAMKKRENWFQAPPGDPSRQIETKLSWDSRNPFEGAQPQQANPKEP